MKTNNSKKLFEAALRVMPGGVNSPVRAFKAVGALPHFIARARGVKLYDVDGNAFVDYVMSWGPLVLGHAAPRTSHSPRRRSEEHTSELQSRLHLVCRLLLEKKKKHTTCTPRNQRTQEV